MKKNIEYAENHFRIFVEKNLFPIAVTLLLFFTLWIRVYLIPYCDFTSDYSDYLLPWVTTYRQQGGLAALSMNIGDYYVPYNILLALFSYLPVDPYIPIAILSCIFEYLSVYFIYKIVNILYNEIGVWNAEKKSIMISLIVLYIPVTFLNSALWKQCDSIYTCFAIISLYYILKGNYTRAFLSFSIGFCFKQQILFFLPVFILLYLVDKRVYLYHFFYIPLAYLIAGLPAVLSGRSAKDVYLVYYNQTGSYASMYLNMPNVYAIFGLRDYNEFIKPALIITISVLIFATLFLSRHKHNFNKINTVYLAIWTTWTCVMFLPSMHERYLYMTVVMITFFYLVVDTKKFAIAIVLNLISLFSYVNYLFDLLLVPIPLLALIHTALYCFVSYDVFKLFLKPKKIPA